MPDPTLVKQRIDAIEAEMKYIGYWSDMPLPPEAYNFHQAFAMDTMAFSQWLQYVFVPRVNQLVASGGPFPTRSQVGAQAVREFDGANEASRLVSLLSEFDRYAVSSGDCRCTLVAPVRMECRGSDLIGAENNDFRLRYPSTSCQYSTFSLMIRRRGYAHEQDGAMVASPAAPTPAPD
jgi:uncharacterized protein YqcC (DUF446 family)